MYKTKHVKKTQLNNTHTHAFYYLMIGWCILNSGAWVLRTNKVISIINVIFVCVCMVIYLSRQKKSQHSVNRHLKTEHIFFGIITFTLLMSFVINSDYNAYITYINVFTMLMLGFLIVKFIKFEQFAVIFVNIILCISVISIVFWLLNDIIRPYIDSFPTVEGMSASYKNLFVYLYPLYVPYRNPGIFWEPGAYQVFLNLALCSILLLKDQRKIFLKVLILVITILSTGSTTGYILLIFNLASFIFSKKYNKKRIFLGILILVTLIALFTSEFFMRNIETKLMIDGSENASSLQRMYSTRADKDIILKNPLTGVGFSKYMSQVVFNGFNNGVYITVSSNTITYLGAVLGIIPMISILLGLICYSYNYQVNFITRFFVSINVLLMFIPENFVDKSLLYILMFYGFNRLNNRRLERVMHDNMQ